MKRALILTSETTDPRESHDPAYQVRDHFVAKWRKDGAGKQSGRKQGGSWETILII